MFDDHNDIRQIFAELLGKLDIIDEKLDGIVGQIEKIEDKLDGQDYEVGYVSGPRATVNPPDIAGPYDISKAVSDAIKETGPTSYVDMGQVIKAARGKLQRKGKQFQESELLEDVRQRELFRHIPVPENK